MHSRFVPLLAVSCLLLAACSGKDDDSGASGSTTNNPTTTPSTGSTGSDSNPTGNTASSTTGGTDSTSTGNSTTAGTTGDTTGNTEGTSGSTSTGTTAGGECEIDPPAPGRCDGGALPPPRRPTLASLTPEDMHAGVAHGSKLAADDEDPDFATTGCAFICDTTGGEEDPCDIWAQDCPEGEKCNAWANDGGSSWNSTKCVPIDLEPDKIGDPCTTQGGGVSGIDSCELGAMCWGVGDDNLGTCVELCTCTPDNPVCMTPNTTCAISNNESLILCLPICDPLDTEACGADELCVSNPSGDYFICVVDASGDAGQAGDPCEYLNACDPGHYCGGSNQCAPYCSLSQPECPQGSECVPWYENGQAPQCFEDLGACV